MNRLVVGTEVIVVRGNDKGKRGKVSRLLKDKNRVVVEGVNQVKRHLKPTPQRQGGILEARGDRSAALAAYEEALRVNPTDVSTMTGLGRLYFAAADWEKARRIYQSLVLQNIDDEAGVTKGEVYWALGKIHLELGQPPKAKSMFQRGLEIEPHNPKLKEALSSLS